MRSSKALQKVQSKVAALREELSAPQTPASPATAPRSPAAASQPSQAPANAGGGGGGGGAGGSGGAGGEEPDGRARQKIDMLQSDLKRRQESYIRRERAYRTRLEELEDELSQLKAGRSSWFKGDSQMNDIRGMHGKILANIDQVQDRTARILQEQERDLLRAFRARLFDVQSELEKERNKTDDGATAWIEKSRQLEAEFDWAKEMADRLDRVNQALGRENLRLKTQHKVEQADREFLIKQLVAVKKDNARLRQEYDSLVKEREAGGDAPLQAAPVSAQNTARSGTGSQAGDRSGAAAAAAAAAAAPQPGHSGPEADNRYKEIIKRLKRLLDVERRNLKQVRATYAAELQQRSELELFLRQCVEDVRHEIAQRRAEEAATQNNVDPASAAARGAQPAGMDPADIPLSEFSVSDRQRAMELLLSSHRVLSLLYDKTFSAAQSSKQAASSIDISSVTESDINGIYDELPSHTAAAAAAAAAAEGDEAQEGDPSAD